MKQPRQLWFHPESDSYVVTNLTHTSSREEWESMAECDDVTGHEYHEEQYRRTQNATYKTNWQTSRDAWNQWQHLKKNIDRIAGIVQNGNAKFAEEDILEWKEDFKKFLEGIVHAKQLTEKALEKIK